MTLSLWTWLQIIKKGNEAKAHSEYKVIELSWAVLLGPREHSWPWHSVGLCVLALCAWCEQGSVSQQLDRQKGQRLLTGPTWPLTSWSPWRALVGWEIMPALIRAGQTQWRHWESWRWAHHMGPPREESSSVCREFAWGQRQTVFPFIQKRLCRNGWICSEIFFIPPFPEDENFFI